MANLWTGRNGDPDKDRVAAAEATRRAKGGEHIYSHQEDTNIALQRHTKSGGYGPTGKRSKSKPSRASAFAEAATNFRLRVSTIPL
jgi:hypothetical protein